MRNPIKFIQEVKQEAFKVSWPTGKETLQGAIMVFLMALAMSIFFLLLDQVLKFFLELIKLDPISKNFVKPSDTQRVIRAYEVKLFTKRSIYDWFKSTRSDYENDDFFKIYIDFPRAELIKRIEDRTQDMIKNGAVSEVKKFIKLKVPKVKTASKAIGIAEIREYLKKKIEISEVIQKISIKTRQYAKRQSTWGRGNMMDWNKIKSEDLNKFLKKNLDITY